MSKYIDVHNRVRLYLKASAVTFSDQLLLDGVNAGLKAILPWVPKKARATIVTSGSDISLPNDVYLVDAVYDSSDGKWLKHHSLRPGDVSGGAYAQWVEYPHGHLTLSLDTYSDRSLDVYYHTTWTEITTSGSDIENIEAPAFVDLALIYYASSYCLASAAMQSSQIRQFNNKMDSGNPEDNPLKDMSNVLMQRFMNEVKLFPQVEKAIR